MQSPSSMTPAHAAQTNGQTDLAYILGSGHSGSTLLAMLLGSHPQACTIGEMRVPSIDEPENYLCSCGEPIKKCQFWIEVAGRMARKGVVAFDITNAGLSIQDARNRYVRRLLKPLPRGPALEAVRSVGLALSPAWPSHLREVHLRNVALSEVLREMTGAKVVVDSSKIALHLKYLVKCPKLTIKVLHLIRDGRAVVTSMLGHGYSRGERSQTMAAAALVWRQANETSERVLTDLPSSQWIRVVYEDLCKRPDAVLRTVYDFLGIDAGHMVLDFRSRQQHILGNDMRLKSTSEIRVDERWRKVLSHEDLAIFDKVAGNMNRRYGYE